MPTTPSKTGVKAPVSSSAVQGININTKSDDKLGRELTNPNWGAKNIMDIEAEYKANASKKKAPTLNAEEALKYDMNLMYKLQMTKFKAHPELVQAITDRGGVKFLEASEHTVGVKGSRWEGKGTNSNFIKVLIKSYQDSLNTTQPQAPVTNEVKGSIQLQLIEDLVQQGKAKTTVRRYDKESGIYKSEAGNLYNLVNRGKVRMVGDKIIGKGISYTLDEFGAAEGFGDWAGFVKAAKYAGIDIQTGKEVFLYDITPAGKAADKVRPVFDSLPSKSSTPTMTYAGIGSRETPQEVLDKMTQAATYLESLGYTLRSGRAKGADTAFEKGVKSKKQIFGGFDATGDREKAVAHEIHPNLTGAMEASKKRAIANGKNGERSAWAVENLMARNTNQIFGENLDTPVDFVLAYDPSGWIGKGARPQKGGTLQAIEMAYRKGIPVINMADTNWKDQLKTAIANKPAQETLDFKTMPDFTIDRKREILSNFALKHGITKDEAYKYINEAFNNPTKNKEDIIKKLKECY